MKRLSMVEKILLLLTAFGGLLIVSALALFALTGSGFAPDVLRSTAGFVLGIATVALLTRPPRRGRSVAALLLLASLVGSLAFVLKEVVLLPAAEEGRAGMGFIVGLLSSTMGASVARLVGINHLGPRGDQPPRRRW